MQLLDGLVTLFKALSPFRVSSRPVSLKHSPFKELPLELIGSIAEFLPLSDAASFTLTCRPIWFILGNQYLDRLSAKDHQCDRLAFLDLLQRDLPRQILCHSCQLLHSGTTRRHNTRWGPPFSSEAAPCTLSDLTSSVDQCIQNRFSSVTFQSAMKLHRYGLDCSEQLSLLTEFYSSSWTGCNYQYESTPRIVNGHFLLRHQVFLLFPVGWEVIFPTAILTKVCPHWDFNMYSPKTTLGIKMDCRVSHWDDVRLNSSCPTCSGLFQCEICPTEFQIDVKDFLKNGVALIVTRWLDLGEGRTLSDPRYASHILHRYSLRRPDDPVPFEAGSIRAAYEGGDFDTEKLLTPKHKKRLFMYNPLPGQLSTKPTTKTATEERQPTPQSPRLITTTTMPPADTPAAPAPAAAGGGESAGRGGTAARVAGGRGRAGHGVGRRGAAGRGLERGRVWEMAVAAARVAWARNGEEPAPRGRGENPAAGAPNGVNLAPKG